jgi:hypothetical protein
MRKLELFQLTFRKLNMKFPRVVGLQTLRKSIYKFSIIVVDPKFICFLIIFLFSGLMLSCSKHLPLLSYNSTLKEVLFNFQIFPL